MDYLEELLGDFGKRVLYIAILVLIALAIAAPSGYEFLNSIFHFSTENANRVPTLSFPTPAQTPRNN